MSGTVTKDENGTVADEIPAGNPVFSGTHSTGDCTSALGPVKPSVNSKLCLHIPSNTDTGTVTGCGGLITFTLNVTGVVICKYEGGTITTSPEDAKINIFEQEVKEDGSLFLCPDTGKLDMEFLLTKTDGTTLVFKE